MEFLNINEAFQLTGKTREAELLRILTYWQTKAQVKRDGHIWIVKTADELIEDGMTCSKPTIYRTLKKLEKKSLIVVIHRPHPFKKALYASWIRVTLDPGFIISPKLKQN